MFPGDNKYGVDFGVIRVCEASSKALALKNNGKYTVGFKMQFKSAYLTSLFNVVPEGGEIDPGKIATAEVR